MSKIETKFYNGTNDQVFKAIFCRKENNYYMLRTLIERCLKKKIEIIKVELPELLKENIYEKGKTVDVFARVDNKVCLIEMNSGYYEGLHNRNASYIFKQYSEETKVGEDYKEMANIIQINFSCKLPEKYPILSKYEVIDKETEIKYIDNLIIYEYNIDRIKKENEKGNTEYNFLAMLKSRPEELSRICKGDKFMEKFKEDVEKLNQNSKFINYMTAEEDARKVHNTLIKNAKEEGIKQTAKNMLENKIPLQTIIKCTGLTEKQIENLK